MKVDLNLRRLLNFDSHESAIWDALLKGSMNISALAGQTGFPRTTLYTALSSLKNRGLISLREKGRSVIVSPISPAKALASLQSNIIPETVSDFRIIKGKRAIFEVWEKLTSRKNERLCCIQPTRALLSMIKNYKAGEFVPLNEIIKKNRIIMDAILKEDAIPAYLKHHKGDRKTQREIAESLKGRMADVSLVRNEYLNIDTELVISSKSAIIINSRDQIAIEIENKNMVELLKELFELAKGYGAKIDFNEYMKLEITKI